LNQYPRKNAWHNFNVLGPADSISSAGYDSAVVWVSTNDLAGYEIPGLLLRCVPYDEWAPGMSDSITIYLDNNIPPAVSIDPMPNEVNGNIIISFTMSDPEDDNISYAYDFSFNNNEWSPATISTGSRSHNRSTGTKEKLCVSF